MAYVTLADIRQHGGYGATELGNDAEISALIPRAEAAIEQYTSTVFEVLSPTTRTFDAIADVDGYILYFDTWLATATSLVVTNGDGDTVASSNYVTLPRNNKPIYALQLKTSSTVVWEYDTSPEGAISVDGFWGYSQSVPYDVQQATIQLVLHWLRLEDQSEVKALPDDVCKLLKPYRKAVHWL